MAISFKMVEIFLVIIASSPSQSSYPYSLSCSQFPNNVSNVVIHKIFRFEAFTAVSALTFTHLNPSQIYNSHMMEEWSMTEKIGNFNIETFSIFGLSEDLSGSDLMRTV